MSFNLRSENEILATFQGKKRPFVSVCCITYNHGFMIEEAICSFLAQKTDFPFEIIIGDDKSTDETPDIIKKYQSLYPNIIKVITPPRNTGSRLNTGRVHKIAKGKYRAICEGDDYWTDENKLAIMMKYANKYPQVKLFCHSAETIDFEKNSLEFVVSPDRLGLKPDKYLSLDDERKNSPQGIYYPETVIPVSSAFCATSSLFIHHSIFDSIPDWFYQEQYYGYGDEFFTIYASIPHGALFVDKIMSIYRNNVPFSSTQQRFKNPEYMIKSDLAAINTLMRLDKESGYKYHDSFPKRLILYKTRTLEFAEKIYCAQKEKKC